MLNQNFTLNVLANLAVKEGFSIDELVIEVRRMFETDGMAGLVNVIVQLLDLIVHPPLLGRWDKEKSNCCDRAHYVVHQQESKGVRPSVGKLSLPWTRLRCEGCRGTFIP